MYVVQVVHGWGGCCVVGIYGIAIFRMNLSYFLVRNGPTPNFALLSSCLLLISTAAFLGSKLVGPNFKCPQLVASC